MIDHRLPAKYEAGLAPRLSGRFGDDKNFFSLPDAEKRQAVRDQTQVHLGFAADDVLLEEVFHLLQLFYPFKVTPPMLHIYDST